MKNSILVIITLFVGDISVLAQREERLPPEGVKRHPEMERRIQAMAEQRRQDESKEMDRIDREIELKRQAMLEKRRQDEAAADVLWRDKWISDKLTEPPSLYYFEAYLRARNAEQLEHEQKKRRVSEAIKVLENIRKQAPEWKPSLVEKKITELRKAQNSK